MNFSDLISREIAKKKKEKEKLISSNDEKCINKSKVEKRSYSKAQDDDEKEKDEDTKRMKILKELNEAKRRQLQQQEEEQKKQEEQEQKENMKNSINSLKNKELMNNSITDEELANGLRSFNEPIKLFGETKIDCIKRLDSLITKRKLIEERKEQLKKELEIDFNIIPTDIRDNKSKVSIQLRSYIKYLLKEWELFISKTDIEHQSLLVETKKDLVPLLVMLRKEKIDDDIFITLSTTFQYLQQKDYQNANDSYLKLSIGNVAWPIGVINIGIHARSAHSKLTGADKKSNIMSDEITRKWLMGIKRLITFAEKKWPN
ncbi:hypothetical protein PACTADRAFT_31494 [Pachysolen tannophilus NRRL Y-2460]|uniref:Pre-mRNA-splicing factor 18 n=1 Tax=Pachysolen tannophilus NRRL Y-2460 TaxID=669874 RepID=A0A1E4U245_PACTA|nr:hypothetical protein PACTADRAFT_31494 [Pachysolen tannophilus NRRL Y-2460]